MLIKHYKIFFLIISRDISQRLLNFREVLLNIWDFLIMNNFYPCFLHSITRFRTYTSNVDCRKHLAGFILILLILQIVYYKSLWDSMDVKTIIIGHVLNNKYYQLLYFYGKIAISNLFVKYFSSYDDIFFQFCWQPI